ncbi:hypothetical protein UFOVP860_2 [uncultured Caudovirales phage]|uniref:Bacteriophage lambda, GpH, tail tape measure, C-terminal n=1 Tax=uncultured Caudovirales phage TaxID=2100421 RepID=A0A6J5RNB0_9CAUD|nr:hypothetical protein UFOVP860_2 [uncultured Caudovirales phage]CAB4195211.1 hypothetical protein UFOVP1293_13 [uncultured Caudovirales phage]CAB4222417.1 hypothetical protein UFOVP1644_31 [uncultured Caudovirales phage]
MSEETTETTKIIRIVVDSSAAVGGAADTTKALQNLEKQAGALDSTLSKIDQSLGGIGSMLRAGAIVGAIGLALNALKQFNDEIVQNIAKTAEQAAALSMTSERFQVYTFTLAKVGLAQDAVAASLDRQKQQQQLALAGNAAAIDGYTNLGVKILDANGKLRDYGNITTEVARAILAMTDADKQSAAAKDMLGLSGLRAVPALKQLAGGYDDLERAARAAHAVLDEKITKSISESTVKSLQAGVAIKGFYAEVAMPIQLKFIELHIDAIAKIVGLLKEGAQWTREFYAALAGGAAVAAAQVKSGLSDYDVKATRDKIAELERQIAAGAKPGTLESIGYAPEGRAVQRLAERKAELDRLKATLEPLESRAAAATAAVETARLDRERGNLNSRLSLPIAPPVVTRSSFGGDKSPDKIAPPGAAGASDLGDERYKRLISILTATAEAQDQMTEASRQGDVQFLATQVHLEAQTKVLEIYGRKLDATNPKIKALTEEAEALIRRDREGKAATTFNVATTELEKQNVLLEAQNRLRDLAPEDLAKEIALIKARNEAEKAGEALNEQDIERRRASIEQNEKFKKQAEEQKQTAERWSAPWKNAFQSIQQAGADAWERILQGGRLTFESIADVARVSLRRVAAELINLATIRPLLGFGAQALGSLGILAPSTVQAMGFGGSILGGAATGAASGVASAAVSGGASGGGGLLGGIGTRLGFGSLFSGGSTGGGFFGGIGSWLNSPIMGAVQGPIMPGAAALPGAGLGGLGNLTPMGAIGGLASMGFGIYNMATAKTPLGALGGGLGLVGGGLGLAAGAGLIGSAFGPIGMGIGLLGGLLGLFGGGGNEPPIPPQPELVLNIGGFMGTSSGRFYSAGSGSGGGGSLRSTAQGVGSAVSRLFRASDVSPIPSQMFGGSIISGVDHVLNGRNWQDRPYTQAGINPPGGGVEWVTYNDPSRNVQQAADLLIAAVFRANVMRGGVSGATEALKAGLTAYDPQTAKDTQTVVALAGAYDKLGKVTGTAKEALEKITASFDDLADFADRATLSLKPINDEIAKQSTRWAQDFIDGMLDPLAVQLRALSDERDSALASAEYIRKNVTGVYVDMDKIATYYTNKEAALRDQFYQGAVENLQNLIARLSYGDLANASPDTSLSGTRANYLSTLAQARAGVSTAITSLPGVAETYASTARGYFASGPEYAALVADIRRNLEVVAAVATGGATSGPAGAAQQISESQQMQNANIERLVEIVSEQSRKMEDLTNAMATANLRMGALASNRM